MKPKDRKGKAFHLSIDYSQLIHKPEVDNFFSQLDDDELYFPNLQLNWKWYIKLM